MPTLYKRVATVKPNVAVWVCEHLSEGWVQETEPFWVSLGNRHQGPYLIFARLGKDSKYLFVDCKQCNPLVDTSKQFRSHDA